MSSARNYPSPEEIEMVINTVRGTGLRPTSVEVRPDGAIRVSEDAAGAPGDEWSQWESKL